MKYKYKTIFSMIIILIISFSSSFYSHGLKYDNNLHIDDTRILIIFSYDPDFDTIIPIENGIKSAFKDANVNFNIEFMNSKGNFSKEHFYNYYMSLKYKLENVPPYDIIFVSDDNALLFIEEYGNLLFKDIPIVFTGINNLDNARQASLQENLVGIIEQTSLEATISLAYKLQPDSKRIYAISDDTFTGQSVLKQFKENAYLFPSLEFKTLDLSNISFKELKSKLATMTDEDIVLLISAYKDVNLKEYTFKRSTEFILSNSTQPVYHLYEHGISQGLIGGKVVSHYDQGREAALIGRSILEGKSISDFKQLKTTNNKFIINYKTLSKYKLDQGHLPDGSILINYEKSFIEKYFYYILFLLTQFLVIIALIKLNLSKKSTQTMLENLIYRDNLTNLLSRYTTEGIISTEISRNNDLALIFIDIDNFKNINDNSGHSFGDQVLKFVANTLLEIKNDDISICRFSGDEFLIVASKVSTREQCMWIINSIQNLFAEGAEIDKHVLNLTFSIGIALSTDIEDINKADILKMADLALYKAKSNGRNTFCFYEETMGQELKEKIEFQNLIKQGMKNNEFELFYQPFIDTRTKDIVGFEALIRWDSPTHGSISPYKLIVNAEEMGLIVDLGYWIISEAFRFSKSINLSLESNYRISINISPSQILDTNFISVINELIDNIGVNPDHICFEITESTLIESFEASIKILNELLQLGFDIVLDDFGTGYSSLSYLKDLPLTGIKIDKSFIDKIAIDLEDMKFVELIIDISKLLNIKVIAEGIESYEQYEILKKLECDFIQGYYFGKPCSKDDAIKKVDIK